MPTKSYRFFDPSHQSSFQHTFQTSDSTQTGGRQQRWSQSAERQDFEDAQSGQDMAHIVPHASWVQYDLSQATPIRSTIPQDIKPYTQHINLYTLSEKTWNHYGAALLTLHSGRNRPSKQSWISLHAYGSCHHLGSFSIPDFMEVIRFNDAVLCTTVQNSEYPPARLVSYAFQVETIDAASQLRQMLASAAREALPSSLSGNDKGPLLISHSKETVETSMERRLSSWVQSVERQYTPAFPLACPENSGTASFGNTRMRRRGGIDHGSAYWDMEKARALQEAKNELDSMELKRLLVNVQLAV